MFLEKPPENLEDSQNIPRKHLVEIENSTFLNFCDYTGSIACVKTNYIARSRERF
eukprot:TRINITY_DN14231_c0_g1_i1.p3 TRINITY_DN14231_c0_g1~~TRINITY_DN14231_c0_g1_i1.p3  ORF type:complete len:55 (-),score=8.54 TRINITY_DN14231_c0_g1_i1:204-368(-)